MKKILAIIGSILIGGWCSFLIWLFFLKLYSWIAPPTMPQVIFIWETYRNGMLMFGLPGGLAGLLVALFRFKKLRGALTGFGVGAIGALLVFAYLIPTGRAPMLSFANTQSAVIAIISIGFAMVFYGLVYTPSGLLAAVFANRMMPKEDLEQSSLPPPPPEF
jgi:hypothetical protein